MNELHYQLDLMRAMNQKLSDREKMYRLLCDTMEIMLISTILLRKILSRRLENGMIFSISRFGTDGTLLSF